jgi:hypothetical protein
LAAHAAIATIIITEAGWELSYGAPSSTLATACHALYSFIWLTGPAGQAVAEEASRGTDPQVIKGMFDLYSISLGAKTKV